MSDLKKTNDGLSRKVMAKEIVVVRTLLREKKYLSFPHQKKKHTSLNEQICLAEELVDFTSIASNNYEEYIPNIISNKPYKQNIVCDRLGKRRM